jgi:tRNA threonylcarbamoyladenosine biosynthesis protein TsaE
MQKIISNSEEETIEFAKKIAKQFNKNTVIVLSGDLGSGKTKFTEGLLKYYGLENEISSPTFTLVNEYNTKEFNIYHFDVYRLSDIDEFFAIGGEEYFEKGACIIEWGEIIESILPKDYIKLTFSRDTEELNKREINIEFFGKAKLDI